MSVDLRPEFARLGLTIKSQHPRGCCSLFAIGALLGFEHAKASGKSVRLSEEFLNWASHRTNSRGADGSFFSDALNGVREYGVCEERLLPYANDYDPDLQPSAEALADAATRKQLTALWIKWWDVKTGMTDAMLAQMKAALAAGHPVAIGMRWPNQERYSEDHVLQMPPKGKVFDGHSIAFVGYRDDASQPGGGVFIFRNSAGAKWQADGYAYMPCAYAALYGNDALWVAVG